MSKLMINAGIAGVVLSYAVCAIAATGGSAGSAGSAGSVGTGGSVGSGTTNGGSVNSGGMNGSTPTTPGVANPAAPNMPNNPANPAGQIPEYQGNLPGQNTANGQIGSPASGTVTPQVITSAQQALGAKGYSVTVDGISGPMTQSAIRQFQSANGINPTGILDTQTLNALQIQGQGGVSQ